MMLAEDDLSIDENFFEEFTSDLSSEDFQELDLQSGNSSAQSSKRDFTSFLSPWEPSLGHVLYLNAGTDVGPCTGYPSTRSSPHTTESTSEYSGGDDRSKVDSTMPNQKRMCRLEKNRASATKCRLKKKNELNSLTSRISELMKTISQLTQENAALRADNSSLTDHNRFLRGLISSNSDLPQYVSQSAVKTDSQQAAGAASGIAILGIFGAFTMFSSHKYWGNGASEHVGRVLDTPLQDLLQEQAGSQLHVFIVGVFLCLALYATVSYGAQHPAVEKKALLPSHKKSYSHRNDYNVTCAS